MLQATILVPASLLRTVMHRVFIVYFFAIYSYASEIADETPNDAKIEKHFGPSSKAIKLHITLDQRVYHAGDTLNVTVDITNKSNKTVLKRKPMLHEIYKTIASVVALNSFDWLTNMWVRCLSKIICGVRISHSAMCTFWKLPHSYIQCLYGLFRRP